MPQADSRRELLVEGEVTIDVLVDSAPGEQGPAIVLLPSSNRDSFDFDDIAQRIALAGYTVLRPQPRGMGRSTGPMQGLNLSVLARDVATTIERLAGDSAGGRAVIVGHAFGHFVARVTDLEHPGRVRGVVVLGGAAREFPAGMAEALAVAANPANPREERLRALQRSMFAPGNDPTTWLEGWHPELRAAYRDVSATPRKDQWWPVTHAQILDLQGEEDPWRPPHTRDELKDVLGEKVTVRVIAGAAHALVPEQPQAVVGEIVEWVGGLGF